MDNDRFVAEFAKIVAQNVEKSPTLARYLSDYITSHPEMVKQVLDSIDPKLVAEHLAKYIVRSRDWSDSSHTIVVNIMKQAQEIAAKEISKSIMQV